MSKQTIDMKQHPSSVTPVFSHLLQRAAISPSPVNEVPPIVHEVLRSPGQPLDAGTRSFMEPRFGHDFSGVRVHTDAKAAESAQEVNALAYTVASDVVFGGGQYILGTTAGRRLMAHELTHVMQQSGVSSGQPLQGEPTFNQPGDAFEQEADAAAAHVVSGAQAHDARAFALGQDIDFSAGQFASQSRFGQPLIALERVHVIQQQNGALGKVQRQPIRNAPSINGEYQEVKEHFQQEQAEFLLEKARNQVSQWSTSLAKWLQAYRNARTPEKQEIQEAIRSIERGLAESLELKIGVLEKSAARSKSGQGQAAQSSLKRELDESRLDLEKLRRIFSPKRKEEFEAMYSSENLADWTV